MHLSHYHNGKTDKCVVILERFFRKFGSSREVLERTSSNRFAGNIAGQPMSPKNTSCISVSPPLYKQWPLTAHNKGVIATPRGKLIWNLQVKLLVESYNQQSICRSCFCRSFSSSPILKLRFENKTKCLRRFITGWYQFKTVYIKMIPWQVGGRFFSFL